VIGHTQMLQALGAKVRKQRRRLGFTLDELAQKSGISKPYLSLIETGRVVNPASDEKLRRLETTLQFSPGELVSQAHLCRTPRDIRAVLVSLMKNGSPEEASPQEAQEFPKDSPVAVASSARKSSAGATPSRLRLGEKNNPRNGTHAARESAHSALSTLTPKPRTLTGNGIDLDDAYLNGVLHRLVEQSASNVERVGSNSVPVINKVSAGYPRDFTDLSYPPRVADEYVGCPEVQDKDAFAARVHGDSMHPKYHEGDIVIFSPAAELRNGDDCFVRLEDGHTTFKRIFFETDDAGQQVIRLQPRNEKYRAQVLLRDQVTGIYRALYRYQRLDGD
jgi:repressor LexA